MYRYMYTHINPAVSMLGHKNEAYFEVLQVRQEVLNRNLFLAASSLAVTATSQKLRLSYFLCNLTVHNARMNK